VAAFTGKKEEKGGNELRFIREEARLCKDIRQGGMLTLEERRTIERFLRTGGGSSDLKFKTWPVIRKDGETGKREHSNKMRDGEKSKHRGGGGKN